MREAQASMAADGGGAADERLRAVALAAQREAIALPAFDEDDE